MSDTIQLIKDKRRDILVGEIGALLHDIGKCHPYFIRTNSKENEKGLPHHAREIDKFMNPQFIDAVRKTKIKLDDEETTIYDFIRYHHDVKDGEDSIFKYLEKCDKMDSADDKGIVRRKQSKDNTIISSPFGFPKERIDLQCLQKRLDDLQHILIRIFQKYISGALNIACFRECLINNLKTTYSHALGETRIPSNDVTLWDHSYSTASLFKSVLCAITLGESPDAKKLQWRIFGLCWDGIGFIEKGRKIADILQRNKIIEEIKSDLRKKFEEEIPIGNAIYEDNNGLYFTFPALSNDKTKELAENCAKIGLEIIRNKSDNELWPFFTLSRASRTLTTLAEELKFASQKRNIPRMTPKLFIEGKEENRFDNPETPVPENGKDICPVCRLRVKPEKDERCDVCEERKKGRLKSWLGNREDTIWIDEVADKNNRIALLTLSFNLDKWLDGTMVGTIYSQSFEEWKDSKKSK